MALILGIGGCIVFQHAKPFLIGDGCQASVAGQVVQLDSEQAAIAATIAGVGYHRRLPPTAVTVAYATALQESHMHNVAYGDRDSVGIFQQRPSQGWGTPSQLMDPVYASTKFFAALVKVPGYLNMPIYRAAQAVQHSADGTAYGQYEQVASMLSAAFTGNASRAVSCWYTPYAKQQPKFAPAMSQLSRTFGQLTGDGATVDAAGAPAATETAARGMTVRVPALQAGWAVATWAVAHAKTYRLGQVRYAGYEWLASSGEHGWKLAQGAPVTAVELS
ncbi:MAG TPA: hypothetical protein VKD26_06940 [Streptosporangiaceae bacterium]|nr:hypothetical protein [Streptosporangiaceae bacterium]